VVSNKYCVMFFLVLCALCFQFLWIVHFLLSLRYSQRQYCYWSCLQGQQPSTTPLKNIISCISQNCLDFWLYNFQQYTFDEYLGGQCGFAQHWTSDSQMLLNTCLTSMTRRLLSLQTRPITILSLRIPKG
jgi:hypothetical protein